MKRYKLAKITSRTPRGMSQCFECACGLEHTLGFYVFAHYHDKLIHDCSACGRRNLVQSGVVKTPIKGPKR